MLLYSCFLTALTALAAAQSAEPVANTTHPHFLPHLFKSSQSVLVLVNENRHASRYPVAALTDEAQHAIPDYHNAKLGSLTYNTPNTSKHLSRDDIALTSCDPSAYSAEISLEDVINDAIQAKVFAIVFYTLKRSQNQTSYYCQLTDSGAYRNYTHLYTLFSFPLDNQTHDIRVLTKTKPQRRAGLWTFETYLKAIQHANPYGTGSTAVAMIILYSITGVITALFLIIIVSGAIRAHRHPERYGPRNSLGRPRQSRAKGIARAMLDTIPIVKFGESQRQPNKDIENHELESRATPSPTVTRNETDREASDSTQIEASAPQVSGDGDDSVSAASPDPAAAETSRSNSAAQPENDLEEGLGCSICTDDFEIGQDIRVLPCNHKFHPACVDPWLLEVSGTCPLCRVDLHPQDQTDGNLPTDDLPPPLDPTGSIPGPLHSNRRRDTLRAMFATRLNRRTLQGSSAEERIEVLRRWREANAANGSTQTQPSAGTTTSPAAGDEEEQNQGNRRLSSLSRLIRRRER